MSEREFHDAVDSALAAIEDAIDRADADIDIEAGGGILTLTLDNGSKVIINRQAPTREIWVAARSGGYHCAQSEGQWRCNTTGERLAALMTRVIAEQGGGHVSFD